MVLSLNSIYKPLNDFFLNKFKTDAGSPILFRFDKIGSVLSDSDFIDPNHPDLGYLPALATEKFSDLVNHIPVDTGDGVNIFLSADSIDTTYFFRLLTASVPYIPLGIDENAKQSIIIAFGKIKDKSQKVWDQVKSESSMGLMLQYMPSLATPVKWYDKSNNDAWASFSFQITETGSEPATSPSAKLWKLKLDDAAMLHALQLTEEDQPQLNIAARVMEVKAAPVAARPLAEVARPFAVRAAVSHLAGGAKVAQPLAEEAVVAPRIAALSKRFVLHKDFIHQSKAMSVSKVLLVSRFIDNNATTETAKTKSMSISFDYCLVKIRRPWYVDAFMNDKSWYVPNVPMGQVTSRGPISMSLMPIGFVAIRNLKIESNNWDPEDVTNASVATQFGPFKVAGAIENNTLSTTGLQIIGWMLQKMPDLPPNDPPK